MPDLYNDQSIPALVWRGATKDGQFDLKRLRDESFKVVNLSRNGVLMHMPNTSLGKRNGIPYGQEDQILHLQKLQGNPYPMGKSPYLNGSVEHMFPRTYTEANPMGGTNGTIRNVSSIGGGPLAISLDDGTELLQRVHNEKFRMHPDNPLSAEFALKAFVERGREPELGPVSNFMRLGLAQDAEDAYILNRKMAAGFLREELNNLPIKMAEKLKEKNELHLSKLNQDVKNIHSRSQQTDPMGVLQGGEGNLIDKMDAQKQQFDEFTYENGDAPSSSSRLRSVLKNSASKKVHSALKKKGVFTDAIDLSETFMNDLFAESERELEGLMTITDRTKTKGKPRDTLADTFTSPRQINKASPSPSMTSTKRVKFSPMDDESLTPIQNLHQSDSTPPAMTYFRGTRNNDESTPPMTPKGRPTPIKVSDRKKSPLRWYADEKMGPG